MILLPLPRLVFPTRAPPFWLRRTWRLCSTPRGLSPRALRGLRLELRVRCQELLPDELTVAHPGETGTLASITLTLGGTALFLVGHALFKWAVFGVLPWSHAVAVAALMALIPVGFAMPTLALSGAAGLIVVGLAVWDTLAYGHMRSPRRAT
jgi:hypothetical protein